MLAKRFSRAPKTAVKATDVSEATIMAAQCDWIKGEAEMLKALLSYDSQSMLVANKARAMSAISTMRDSLAELEAFIEEQTNF